MTTPPDKNRFHDYGHALEYDQRAGRSDIRAQLTPQMVDALELRGNELVLDLAVGTGRFARPVAQRLKGGKVIGLDEATAMLRVGQEQNQKERISRFIPVAGMAEAFPFHTGVFDRVFTSFALHHFPRPSVTVSETSRVLRPKGRFIILDPVMAAAEDSLDKAIHDLIIRILHRTHGENFRYYSAADVHDLLTRAGFRIVRADIHSFFVDQDGTEGIPTGRRWLEIAKEIQTAPADLKKRFEDKYFCCEMKGDQPHIKGSFYFALIGGEKPL
jgi:ubiquinone/menaquinone biosynthesis C-methylase UbiE